MSGLSDQEIELIAQHIVADLTDRGSAGGPERPAGPSLIGELGIFDSMDEAVRAAGAAFGLFDEMGLKKRNLIIAAIRNTMREHGSALAREAFEETGLGRYEDKVLKNQLVTEKTPGTEDLRPEAITGDDGLNLTEPAPYGVIAAITPTTNPTSTIINNTIAMLAAGNAVVFNVHPNARRVSCHTVALINKAIVAAGGPRNLSTCIANPTVESAQALMKHPGIRLVVVTGGGGVVHAAMSSGKRAICAGPGNPPVFVDDTCCPTRAAKAIIEGAAFDNNLLCIGEKQVFVLESVADKLMQRMSENGAVKLNSAQLDRLTKAAFTFKEGQGGGCAHASVNKDFIGKDPIVLAQAVGMNIPSGTQLLFAETDANHPFVVEEQMMPMLPIVRVKSVEEGIERSLESEHGYKHTAIIHSHDVENITAMARALDTTLFVKNGPSLAGLGIGGEGYLSFSVATPTGEGITNPKTFCRVRRCVMVDNLRIY